MGVDFALCGLIIATCNLSVETLLWEVINNCVKNSVECLKKNCFFKKLFLQKITRFAMESLLSLKFEDDVLVFAECHVRRNKMGGI